MHGLKPRGMRRSWLDLLLPILMLSGWFAYHSHVAEQSTPLEERGGSPVTPLGELTK